MRVLEVYWSWALSLVCEVALTYITSRKPIVMIAFGGTLKYLNLFFVKKIHLSEISKVTDMTFFLIL